MTVKWHGVMSGIKKLPGGAPQGASLGLWSFLSQTNDNPEDATEDKIYKFVDDKSILEVINLMSIGIASHNCRMRVPSNVPESNLFIPAENLKTQKYLEDVDQWAKAKQMKLNPKKTKNIIFNFTKNHQFSTDILLDNEIIETVSDVKLLGTIITNDLTWGKNTSMLVREGNIRMQFLHKSAKFTNNVKDLKQIYISQVRSKLEQSAVVWHSSLTMKNECDLERVQKAAMRIILGNKYQGYDHALATLNMKSLKDRRDELCLKFAKKCLRIEKFKQHFPLNNKKHCMSMRSSEKFELGRFGSTRYKKSAIPYLISLLNRYESKKSDILSKISVPMNYGAPVSVSLR